MFGYAEDWSEDDSLYVKYPFILEADNKTEADAIMKWGWNIADSVIDLRGRRIVEGEQITRIDVAEKAMYTVISITPMKC